LSSDMLLFLY